MESILEVNNLKKCYKTGTEPLMALDGVELTIKKGEFISIIGRSGSGKSTLLHLLGGLDTPTEGKIQIAGKDIFHMTEEELTRFRRKNIGIIFQNYNLLPLLNVYENIVLPIQLDKGKVDTTYIDDLLNVMEIADKKFILPSKLSGGQQQRVAIARALAIKPAIILADEPTGNLDSVSSEHVLELLETANQTFGQTILMITHDQNIAGRAQRIIEIRDGRIVGGENSEQ